MCSEKFLGMHKFWHVYTKPYFLVGHENFREFDFVHFSTYFDILHVFKDELLFSETATNALSNFVFSCHNYLLSPEVSL